VKWACLHTNVKLTTCSRSVWWALVGLSSWMCKGGVMRGDGYEYHTWNLKCNLISVAVYKLVKIVEPSSGTKWLNYRLLAVSWLLLSHHEMACLGLRACTGSQGSRKFSVTVVPFVSIRSYLLPYHLLITPCNFGQLPCSILWNSRII